MKYKYLQYKSLIFLVFVFSTIMSSCINKEEKQPNVVIVFLDDSGWSDFEPFGNPEYLTPNIRQMAEEGCRFSNFYVPQGVCSASRAALLSGCFPGRTKVFGAHPPEALGLDPKYKIISEMLKEKGYTTGYFGKWHIGDQPETRPPDRGFDESAGLMYSNDMWEFHPENPGYWGQWPLRFWENGNVKIERVTDKEQKMLTTWYTEYAVDFIKRHKEEPFFLYVPHSMPHVPIFCSEKFEGKSGAGLYGDVMMEIDWSVGEIMDALKENGLEDNTLVVFTSDNGPWVSYGNHAGSTPYREAKGTGFDGGIRSACIMKYPKEIKGNTESTQTICSVDLLPTIANLTGAELPDYEIDGKNVWDIVTGKSNAQNPHEYYPFSTANIFEGVISGDGKWKLHLPHKYRTLVEPGMDGAAGKYRIDSIGLALFDMENDPFETKNVIEEFPQEAEKMLQHAKSHKEKFYSE